MRSLLYRTFILLTVAGLIFIPMVITGNSELQRADFAMEAGNFSEAALHYERSIRFLPCHGGIWEQAATSRFFNGEYEASIPYFERAQKEGVLSANGLNLLGQAYWQLGDEKTAQNIWENGIDIYPDSALLFSPMLATVYQKQGNFAAEQDTLEKMLTAETSWDESIHYRLGLLMADTAPDRALRELEFAASQNPSYEPAVETLRTSIDLASQESNLADRLVIIGRGLGLVSEWELAEQAFQQAVAADGENAAAWAWLGEAEQQLGRGGRANLDRALSLDRTNPIIRSLRGLYWARQGRAQQALAEYLLAAEYDPENPAWQFSIGETYAQLGDLPPALAHFQRATEIAPSDETAWQLLAMFSARYNFQVEEIGLPAAQMAVELTGENPMALDTLGWILTLLSRYDEAIDTLEHAISIDPEFALGYLHLAIIEIETNDWSAAREHLTQAYYLDEDGQVADQALTMLNRYFP